MIDRSEEEIKKNWNMAKPSVVVRVTSFNQERYIAQCLDSILIQETDFPFTIFVHDDASTDKTAEIIREYEKKYPHIFRIIIEEENLYKKRDTSLIRVINSGIDGKYLAMCEGDDYWCYEHKLQRQYDFMENNQEYVSIGHMTRTVDANGEEIISFIDSKVGDYSAEDHDSWQLYAHVSSYFVRAEEYLHVFFKNIGEYDKAVAPGDRKMPLLFLTRGKLGVLDGCWSVYRYMSGPYSFTSQRGNTENYKLYLEAHTLSHFAKHLGFDLNYETRKKQIMYDAFIKKIKNPRDCNFDRIEKIRDSGIQDIIFCIKRLLKINILNRLIKIDSLNNVLG